MIKNRVCTHQIVLSDMKGHRVASDIQTLLIGRYFRFWYDCSSLIPYDTQDFEKNKIVAFLIIFICIPQFLRSSLGQYVNSLSRDVALIPCSILCHVRTSYDI